MASSEDWSVGLGTDFTVTWSGLPFQIVAFIVSNESVFMLVVGLDILEFGVRPVSFECQRGGC
jgi:hypothetical protein